MITIRESLKQIIAKTPYLEEAIGKGIINLSALARLVKPEIKDVLYKEKVSDAALIMALKRLEPEIKKKNKIPHIFSEMEDITVRSGLIEITLRNVTDTEKIRSELMKAVAKEKYSFFNLIQGVRESTILMSKNLEHTITKLLSGKVISRIDTISSVTISLPPSNRKTPGVYYTLLKALAWENINLIEIISNFNEVTLVFDDSDIDRAFSLIKGLRK